jgi:hypothetical protein
MRSQRLSSQWPNCLTSPSTWVHLHNLSCSNCLGTRWPSQPVIILRKKNLPVSYHSMSSIPWCFGDCRTMAEVSGPDETRVDTTAYRCSPWVPIFAGDHRKLQYQLCLTSSSNTLVNISPVCTFNTGKITFA